MPSKRRKIESNGWRALIIGAEWGTGRILRIVGALVVVFAFVKAWGEADADRILPAHRAWVNERIKLAGAPVREDVLDILLRQAEIRLKEVKKQLLDLELQKAKAVTRQEVIKLEFQSKELTQEQREVEADITRIKGRREK